MSIPKNAPQWLHDARTKNAVVDISKSGRVIWYDGVWRGGVWRGGVWHGGYWHGGDWRNGVWRGGVWGGGDWRNGVWHDGDWRGGVWHGGVWRSGVWRGGRQSASRCCWPVLVTDDGHISIGCQTRTVDEWDAILDGAPAPEEAPRRGSNQWRLLRASYLAHRAYLMAMREGDIQPDAGEGGA
jgi:hypothetical protein